MPCVSRFIGIAIYFYFSEHSPPHFHAIYGGEEAVYEIETLRLYAGSLQRRALNMVLEWADQHRQELIDVGTFQGLEKLPGRLSR
jgi:hypothetical protein